MEVYADVLVMENCMVNFFILTLTMKCVRHKCKMVALIGSSFIGGVYTLVLLIPELNIFTSLPWELFVACVMLRIAYGKIRIFSIMKLLIVFLIISFALSGVCFLLSIKQNFTLLGNTFKIEKYSAKYLVLGIMFIYIVCERLVEYIKDRIFVSDFIFEVEFEIEDKKYTFKSFLDTGNELKEPITNLPCILVEERLLSDMNFDGNTYSILYSAIGIDGDLKGIRINNIKVRNKKNLCIEIDAIVCPCKERLSKDCEFNALLSRGIVCKGDIYGKTNSFT